MCVGVAGFGIEYRTCAGGEIEVCYALLGGAVVARMSTFPILFFCCVFTVIFFGSRIYFYFLVLNFLKEVFKLGSIESLDGETLFTIQRFFENNLNVSETSRKLFIHRNTLVYRLEKIKKITGLDLREFDHAIIFKIALMVNKYLKSTPIKY